MTFLSLFSDWVYTLLIGPLQLLFEMIFSLVYRHFNNPGISIIFLSLIVNLLVLPLYQRADKMQSEQRDLESKLQPWISHIKNTFSGDERFMMLQTFYRQNNYRPTSALKGSLALLLEIPFFVAAYRFLSGLLLLKGASFGPIKDLGVPDAMFTLGSITINVLPFLMTAINALSAAVYMKGFPTKNKIQTFGMALIFLVLLYNSPSGLVLYWTLNNLFSLGKNIFYKLNDPGQILKIAGIIFSIPALVACNVLLISRPEDTMRNKIILAFGIILLSSFLYFLVNSSKFKIPVIPPDINYDRLFFLGSLFLIILTGLLIPSALIGSSTDEFVSLSSYYSPFWYILHSALLAIGSFGIWFGIFYKLANNFFKKFMGLASLIFSGVFLVDYMFFGTHRSTINSLLVYITPPRDTSQTIFINSIVVVETAVILFFLWKNLKQFTNGVLLTACLAISIMSIINFSDINRELTNIKPLVDNYSSQLPEIPLSKHGKNVVILMMDRAVGYYVPFIMEERPELQQQFDGFTFYSNTLSFATKTNAALPAIFGGYEYTPAITNQRTDKLLVEKHNEALLMMPRLFSGEDYEVTVIDPSYANYTWIPDLRIYDDYPEIHAYLADGLFSDPAYVQGRINSRNRNFFCFSLYKTAPLAIQPMLYTGGMYNEPDVIAKKGNNRFALQTKESLVSAFGIELSFADAYGVLENLPVLTKVIDSDKNTYTTLDNGSTHEPLLLQMPDYSLSTSVDNQPFESDPITRRSVDGRTITIGTTLQMAHYHADIASFISIGKWMDYLREIGVYDNTRIIIVADHGHDLEFDENVLYHGADILAFNPVLMVKDFDDKGFYISDQFMTNADVPTIAMDGLIEAPVNPFTGNEVTNEMKNDEIHEIQWTDIWDTNKNNGNTFTPATWYAVHGTNIFDHDNWENIGVH